MNTAAINSVAIDGAPAATPTPTPTFAVPRGMPLFPPVGYPPLLFPFLGADLDGAGLHINPIFNNGLYPHRLFPKTHVDRTTPTFRRSWLPTRVGTRKSMQ